MAFAIPAITAGIGLLGSYLGSRGKQKQGKFKQVPTMNPQQMGILSQLLGGAQGTLPGAFNYLQDIFSESPQSEQAFAAPFMRQFQEQTIPQLSALFGGLGAGSSSAFQNALGQAGAGLQENLAGIRGGLRQNALGSLQGLLGAGMQSPFQSIYMQGSPTGMQRFGAGLSGLLPQGIGQLGNYFQNRQLMNLFQSQGG